MCNGTLYKEPPTLSPFTANADQSYERKSANDPTNCTDTDNNAADFLLNASSSNPQTSSSTPQPCLVVTNVTSPDADKTYVAGDVINITVSFSNDVEVSGAPTLLLETGVNHKPAAYVSGSGTNILIFQYAVASGDSSGDLDYVAPDFLALNGGSIGGATGNANLALPTPGSAGSLSFNKNIVLDNGIPPSLISIERQNPSSSPTNANSLVFRATFSETVTNVDVTDFVINSSVAGATISGINSGGNGSYYDLTVSGVNLGSFNGDVGLNLSVSPTINDVSGIALTPVAEPPVDEVYTLDHLSPSVTVSRAAGQADTTSTTPVKFSVVFSEAIDPSTFTVSDIKQNGTARFITWGIADDGDHKNFTVSATSVAQNGTLTPSIDTGQVKDTAGNTNTASSNTNNTVTYNDNVRPTVTVNSSSHPGGSYQYIPYPLFGCFL